jgi:N-acetylneuraminic acid mutarotase
LGTGGRYDPATDTWQPLESAGAPTARTGFTMTWTGRDAIVFGGYSQPLETTVALDSGARYDPGTRSWSALSRDGAPSPRQLHTAIWTGTELIVWGGEGPASLTRAVVSNLNTGARYDPQINAWRPLPQPGAPSPRHSHAAIWTGHEMVVVGGVPSAFGGSQVGGRFNPVLNQWDALSKAGAPTAVADPVAAWTGHEMIVWGGSASLPVGRRYDPLTDAWTPTSPAQEPRSRRLHQGLWTGDALLMFGGVENAPLLPNGVLRYSPTRPLFLYGRR